MLREKIYFITGIDTDAGKSYVTGYLARRLMEMGRKVTTQKLIQTGCPGLSEDIETHRRLMGIDLGAEDLDFTTCPVVFTYPCSPHEAARIDGRSIDYKAIDHSTELLMSRYQTLLIEGAGGLMVPLEDDFLTADFVAERGYPVVVVTSAKLGSINHTLLTLEVCRARGIRVAALAFNHYPEVDTPIMESTIEYLKCYMKRHHAQAEFIEIPII